MTTIESLWSRVRRALAHLPQKMMRKQGRATADLNLQEALARLPEPTRSVYLLSARDGLSYGEIARRLGLTATAVEHELARALLALDRHYDVIGVARAVASDRSSG